MSHVHAGDQQDERHRTLQNEQDRADTAGHFLVQSHQAHSPISIGLWIDFFEVLGNSCHFSLRLFEIDACLKSSDGAQIMGGALIGHRLDIKRPENYGLLIEDETKMTEARA